MKVVATDSGKVTLTWKPPSNDGGSPVTGYILQAAPEGSKDFTDVGRVDGKTVQHEVTGLDEGKDYMFRIKAENPAGISNDSANLDKPIKAAAPISKCTAMVKIHFVNHNIKGVKIF